MGFANIYDNVLSFLLERPDGNESDYYSLVRRNGTEFSQLYGRVQQKILLLYKTTMSAAGSPMQTLVEDEELMVEPRELLSLLNFIECHDTRLSYTPRPFHRSNILSVTSLLQMESVDTIGCLICGKVSAYTRKKDSVCFTTLALLKPAEVYTGIVQTMNVVVDNFDVDSSVVGRVLFSNDIHPRCEEYKESFPEVKRLHNDCCPVMWLHMDLNATWACKDRPYTVRGVSQFHHLLQFITMYPRPREDAAWLSLVNRISKCRTPGASLNTLEKLMKLVCHERLVINAARITKDTPPPPVGSVCTLTSGMYSEPMHVNSYTYDVVNLSDEPSQETIGVQLGEYLPASILPAGGSFTVLPLIEEEMVSARANATHMRPSVQNDNQNTTVNDVFKDCFGSHYYRLLFLQGFLVPSTSCDDSVTWFSQRVVCLCCGAIFRGLLSSYNKNYFDKKTEELLLSYALYGNVTEGGETVYGRRLDPVPGFGLLSPKDLSDVKHHTSDERLKTTLLWFSSSLDKLHTAGCLYRLKRPAYHSSSCPVCYDVINVGEGRLMTCGHEFCKTCYNEVMMVDCCVCRTGHRTQPLSVSPSVIRGYLNRSSVFV